MNSDENHKLKILKRCYSDTEAEIIVQLLLENGIDAFVENNLPHSVWPVSDDALVIVKETDYDQAKLVLEEYEMNSQHSTEEGENPCPE